MFGSVARSLRPRLSRSLVSQTLAEPQAWNQAPVQVTTLPNGVRVATKETFGEVATVGIHLDAGVRSETKQSEGATHVLSQLALGGSKKRARAAFENEVEGLGASLDIRTGREQSSYSITLGKGDLKQGVDIVSDLVTNPATNLFEKEKETIARNLEEFEQPTFDVIQDRLHACAFRDYSLGFSSCGPFENLGNLTQGHLDAYVADHYSADKMVLAAVGPVKHDEIVKLASATLGNVKAGPAHVVGDKPYFCGADLLYRNDEMGATAYVALAFESVPWRSPDAVTFMVMQAIIGHYNKKAGLVPGTISGNRTVNAIANRMGVGCADEFRAFQTFYRDTGLFGFEVACDEVAVDHAVSELMFGIANLSHSVTDEEVERAKRDLKVSMTSGTGSSAAACAEVGQQMLAYGRGVPPAEMLLRIDAVDSEEVKRVAWQYLNDAEIAVSALGPLHGLPMYFELRKKTTMYRY